MDVRDEREERAQEGGARGARRLGLVVALAGLAALALAAALAATGPAEAFGGHGWRGFRHGHHGPGGLHDPERIGEHAALFLRMVDASDEQQASVQAIVTQAARDLEGVAERHHQNRAALVAAIGGPSVDRAALESLRSNELALADEASRRLASALADAAEVLSPEQRAELVELAERFGRHRHGHGEPPR
jgi:Spy/CpxP family protein refolding chaperone